LENISPGKHIVQIKKAGYEIIVFNKIIEINPNEQTLLVIDQYGNEKITSDKSDYMEQDKGHIEKEYVELTTPKEVKRNLQDEPWYNLGWGIVFSILGFIQSNSANGSITAAKKAVDDMNSWAAAAEDDANYAGYYLANYEDWGGSYYYNKCKTYLSYWSYDISQRNYYANSAKGNIDSAASSTLTSNIAFFLGGYFINRGLEKNIDAKRVTLNSLQYPQSGLKLTYRY
jgi:hypothetical protein